ncbi:hypothetical protein CH339_14710 [Rhodobium orientis]|uniref:Uncharacterized protein n=2 Tax=Rhodobium orientis TaxID=34017 RepID=A0A327JKS0_9HYPH|nr:hypothetical protein CH339_14710 [Rhodobium orientis]
MQNGDFTDILFANNTYVCGFGPFASFHADTVESWFQPFQKPDRTTRPGDPLFNMSEDERKTFQMMQGIIQGEKPVEGLRPLFGNN